MTLVYKTKATTNGHARESVVSIVDGIADLTFSLPKELGGAGVEKGYNPEQLLASGYSACFEGAVNFLYSSKITTAKTKNVSAEVNLLKREGGFTFAITITSAFVGISQEEAAEIVKKAHEVCPFSYALKNNIQITDIVVIE